MTSPIGYDERTAVAHDLEGVAQRLVWHSDRFDRLVLSNAMTFDAWPIEVITGLGLPATNGDMAVGDVVNTPDASPWVSRVRPDEYTDLVVEFLS